MDMEESSGSISTQSKTIRSLWGFGVSGAIIGNFFGWNYGLTAGYAGALLLLIPLAMFYALLTCTMSEMGLRFPHAHHSYHFAASCGKFWSFMVGLSDIVKMVALNAALVSSMTSYAMSTDLWIWNVLVWIVALGAPFLHVALGVKAPDHMKTSFAVFTIIVLLAFYISVFCVMDFEEYAISDGWFFKGFGGVVQGLPFLAFMFWGIEQFSFTAAEVSQPEYCIPRVIAVSLGTITVLSLLTVTFGSAMPPGLAHLITDDHPLLTGFQAVFKSKKWITWIALIAVLAVLEISLDHYMNVSGDLVYSLASDSLFSGKFAHLHQKSEVPLKAMAFTGFSSIALLNILWFAIGKAEYTQALLTLTMASTFFSYTVQFCAYLRLYLKQQSSDQLKPLYASPFGVPGAGIGAIFSSLVLMSLIYYGTVDLTAGLILVFFVLILAIGSGYFHFTLWPSLKAKDQALLPPAGP